MVVRGEVHALAGGPDPHVGDLRAVVVEEVEAGGEVGVEPVEVRRRAVVATLERLPGQRLVEGAVEAQLLDRDHRIVGCGRRREDADERSVRAGGQLLGAHPGVADHAGGGVGAAVDLHQAPRDDLDVHRSPGLVERELLVGIEPGELDRPGAHRPLVGHDGCRSCADGDVEPGALRGDLDLRVGRHHRDLLLGPQPKVASGEAPLRMPTTVRARAARRRARLLVLGLLVLSSRSGIR